MDDYGENAPETAPLIKITRTTAKHRKIIPESTYEMIIHSFADFDADSASISLPCSRKPSTFDAYTNATIANGIPIGRQITIIIPALITRATTDCHIYVGITGEM